MPVPNLISSPANPTVKHLIRMRDNRARRKAGRVIVDGWRETAQALRAGLTLVGIYCGEPGKNESNMVDSAAKDPWRQQVIDHADSGPATTWVTPPILEKIGYGQSHRGVVAEFHRPSASIAELDLRSLAQRKGGALIFVLDQIEKPGNVGAIFRTADAAGVDAILLCDGGDALHPNAIRSSSGGVFHVPWAQGSQEDIGKQLIETGFRVVAARVESSDSLWNTDWQGAVAVVMGSEAEGLGNRWQTIGARPTEGVHIPMAGQVDSLNVSVAAAVIAMTAAQQRTLTTNKEG